MRFWIPIVAILAVGVSTPGSVRCDDFYVDAVSGNDETGDGSQSNPWRKLQFAINSIGGTPENPHTIHLAPGFYNDSGSGDETPISMRNHLCIRGSSPWQVYVVAIRIGGGNENINISSISTLGIKINGMTNNISFDRLLLRGSTMSSISLLNDAVATIANSVMYHNDVPLECIGNSSLAAENCVLWNCKNPPVIDEGSTLSITYSNLEYPYPGEGNITVDPIFSDPDHGDFRLGYGSPCIDAGNPDSPVPPGGGDRIDMGCSEYLFEPQPVLVAVITTEITGNENSIPEYGEILETRVEVMNTGEAAESMTAELFCDHPDVTMLIDTVSYPDLASGESAGPVGDGFQWQVTGESGWCVPADFTMTWMASGARGMIPLMFNLHGPGPHIDPDSGSDLTGTGSPSSPYKTLTHALKSVRGGRWSPVTAYAHAGTYSSSSNGEIYPIFIADWESIQGDGRDTVFQDNEDILDHMIYAGLYSSIRNISVRTESLVKYSLIRCTFADSTMENCYLERVRQGSVQVDYAIMAEGFGYFTMKNCAIKGSGINTSDFRNDVLIENNEISGYYNLCSGRFINNRVGDLSQAHYSYINDPMIILGNVLEYGGTRSEPGRYEFTDNIILFAGRGFGGAGNNKIVRNIALDGGFTMGGPGFTTSHNISLGQKIKPAVFMGTAYLENSIAASLKPSLQQYAFYGTLLGAFSLDNCIGAFGATGVFWAGAAWSNHGIYYHNRWGEGECHDAWYNDLEDCPAATNMDLDPEFVGTGIITALGPGFLHDSTAAWEPDRYAGYYVNPDAPNQDTQFYITGNDADTLYVMGNPGVAASVGDRFFFPDFHLRRISDGYAWDSPLIDAGNPDPAYNDPDGSRCDLGPYGGPLATTPMPEIPTWPPPDTPTPTVTPTPSMTPTPVCDITGVTIEMPREMYYPGDTCYVTVTVCNTTGSPLLNYPLFVILDVYSTFFFGPGFTGEYDSYLPDHPVFPSDVTFVPVLDPFIWPETGTSAAAILFHAALTDPEVSLIFGDMDSFEFGWAQ